MVKISSKLKKLLVCGASLALMASLSNGINNVSAHSVHHHTYTERIIKRNRQFTNVMKYLHWVNWYDRAHSHNFNGWKLRHLDVYMQGLTHYQKRVLNRYKVSLKRYNRPVRHHVRKSHKTTRRHATKRIKRNRSNKRVRHIRIDQSYKHHRENKKQTRVIIPKKRIQKQMRKSVPKTRTHKNKGKLPLPKSPNDRSLRMSLPKHIDSNSRVNNYIVNNHLQHAKVQRAILKYLPHIPYAHGVGHPDGVVVHETGNPYSNIYGEINFMKHDWNNAFVHSFVDSNHIINIANTNYQAWGVAYPGNAHFLQFEQTEMHNKRDFAKEVNNAAYYTAYLLKQYNLKPKDAEYTGKGTVWSHALVARYMGGSDHIDPVTYYANNGRYFFGQPYTMHQFYKLVLAYYNN